LEAPLIKAFEYLGESIAKRWKALNCREDGFAEIATCELTESKVLTDVDPDQIVTWLMQSECIPEQKVSAFGQPPVRVYTGDGFYIEALFWIDGTTAIHEHAFVGAFGVLHGSSVQSTYSFVPERAASERLLVGQTSFLGSELLYRGNVRPIHAGDRLVHSLFHLDRPSVSVVVRTSEKLSIARPQYFYFKPYLALCDFDLPNQMVIQSRMLESLSRTDIKAFWKAVRQIVGRCEPFMLFRALLIAFQFSDDADNWNGLLTSVDAQNRWLLDYIVPSLQENDRAKKIRSLRATIHDPTQRFFLALLLNVPTRAELFRLITERFPDDSPSRLVVQWLGVIFGEKRAGIQLNPSMLFVLDLMLQDPDFAHSKGALRDAFRCEKSSDEEKIREFWTQLQANDVLKPLLTAASL
jgi:hypothetical protein